MIYHHDEPAPINGNCRITRTEEEVIVYMKKTYHGWDYEMPDDATLINEYIVLHYAWGIEDELV